MNAEILTVGTELLLGDILNSNSQFLSRELAAYGIQLLYQSTVGDNNARLKQVLSLALSRSDMVVITGGLGPTPDDLTRETVCEVLDIPLMLHEESWARIQEYFANTGRELSPSNKKQAMLPEGCVVFPNDHGTAPGCAIERDGHVVILLPGPPAELIPMFNDKVAPYLSKFSGGTIFSQTVGVFGIPESTVAERLADLLSEANPTVAPYAKDGEVTLRVTARAADTETARTLCAPIVEEIRKRLGAAVYGVDSGSLQKAVVTLLKEKGKKIATAESCTAGMLSGRLTEVSGVSSVFECGIAAYSKEIKHQVLGVPEELLEKYGAVSAEVASAMAVGARRVGQADLGIGITGVAGPETSEGKPVGTVFIALADEKRTWVKKIVAGHSGGEREYVRYIATSHALDLTRRYLEALPAVMAGGETLEEPKEAAPQIPVAPKSGKQRRFLATIFPWKGDSLKERVWKIVAWVAVLAVLVTGGLLINQFVLMPVSNRALFGEILEIYGNDPGSLPPDVLSSKKYPEGMLSRFYGLYDRNKDIGGWIKIDGTNVNYPVMKDTRNQFYRDHNYDHGDGWITDLSQMSKLKPLADDPKARAEFMDIKYKNKERLAKYILEHNGVEIDPRSIYDVQVKRLHEYKRQLLNILHVMYLYNQIKEHPEMSFYPRTFIFGAKASAGYVRAKEIIKLINSVADVVNNDLSINGKLKVVFIEDYRVSNAEWIFAAADVSEQISTASKEASGTGNMKFMLNGAPTLGTMDGANVEIVEEVGIENAFIFGLSSDEVINYENNGGYNPQEIYFNDWDIKRVVDQLMDGTYSHGDHEMFRDLYNSLLNTQGGDRPDRYFILKDFRSYAEAQKKVEEAYKDPDRWAKMALLNTASCGKFTSDRTIQEYVDNIWKLDYVTVKPEA